MAKRVHGGDACLVVADKDRFAGGAVVAQELRLGELLLLLLDGAAFLFLLLALSFLYLLKVRTNRAATIPNIGNIINTASTIPVTGISTLPEGVCVWVSIVSFFTVVVTIIVDN